MEIFSFLCDNLCEEYIPVWKFWNEENRLIIHLFLKTSHRFQSTQFDLNFQQPNLTTELRSIEFHRKNFLVLKLNDDSCLLNLVNFGKIELRKMNEPLWKFLKQFLRLIIGFPFLNFIEKWKVERWAPIREDSQGSVLFDWFNICKIGLRISIKHWRKTHTWGKRGDRRLNIRFHNRSISMN